MVPLAVHEQTGILLGGSHLREPGSRSLFRGKPGGVAPWPHCGSVWCDRGNGVVVKDRVLTVRPVKTGYRCCRLSGEPRAAHADFTDSFPVSLLARAHLFPPYVRARSSRSRAEEKRAPIGRACSSDGCGIPDHRAFHVWQSRPPRLPAFLCAATPRQLVKPL